VVAKLSGRFEMGEVMRGVLLAVATAAALIGGGALAMQVAQDTPAYDQNTLHPERVVIGLDLSKSNPLVDDPAFAARVAQRVSDIVRKLGFASEVHIRTFGSYDPSSNSWSYDTVLSTRSRPDVVAAEVQKLIAGTPRLVASGRWRSQQKTNILAFLDNTVRATGCGGMPTTIILASDGIEDSDYARLQRGDHLPAPDRSTFRGCSTLAIYGLGQGSGSPVMTARLRTEWEGWAKRAGFSRFEGLNDW
jgi:hypothetical protein